VNKMVGAVLIGLTVFIGLGLVITNNDPATPAGAAADNVVTEHHVDTGMHQGIWISRAAVLKLPTSGPAWNSLKREAERDCGAPNIDNGKTDHNVCIMAKALVFARTGQTSYRSDVVNAIQSIVASGTFGPGGTGVGSGALAMGRELGAFVIAADLIELPVYNRELDAQFRDKLRELRTTPTEGGGADNLIDCHEKRPNNFGTHCGATRAAIAVYLGDQKDLERTAQVFKGWLGDRFSYAGFDYGDLYWQCDPQKPVGINPKSCTKKGHSIDGVLPDDERRAGKFTWPPPKENYVYEGLQGALAQAVILHQQGYDVWNWEDKALLRAFKWLYQEAQFPAEGDDAWQPYVINRVYGTDFPTLMPADPGKNVGWTAWTHQARPIRKAQIEIGRRPSAMVARHTQ
jgi:hypothetical protein